MLHVVLHVPFCTLTIFRRGPKYLTLLRFLAKVFPQLCSCSGNQVMNDTVTFIHNIIHNAKFWHFAVYNWLNRSQFWMRKVTIQCYFDSNQCHQWSGGYDANPDSDRPGFDPSLNHTIFFRLLIITYLTHCYIMNGKNGHNIVKDKQLCS